MAKLFDTSMDMNDPDAIICDYLKSFAIIK